VNVVPVIGSNGLLPERAAEWAAGVPEVLRADALWSQHAYRFALLAADLAWEDREQLLCDRRTRPLADQLLRAACSIGANIAEGYGRRAGRDRARFYEFALGSARESRHWYYVVRRALPAATIRDRLEHLTRIARLLTTAVRHERAMPPTDLGARSAANTPDGAPAAARSAAHTSQVTRQ
jgi:four helix bundle protein